MALIFAPLARKSGKVPVSIGTGAIPNGESLQGLNVSEEGYIFAVLDGEINHYFQGLPFDVNGRLVISQNTPARVSASVPFTSTGGVAGGT